MTAPDSAPLGGEPQTQAEVDMRHKAAMDAIGLLGQLLQMHRPAMEALVKSHRDMDSFGAILNPTLYRQMIYSKSLDQQLRLVKAALSFMAVLDEVKAELGVANV